MNCYAEYIELTVSRFKLTIPGITLLILRSGFLFGSSTSTTAATTSLPFFPFFGSAGGADGVPLLLSFDFETSALSADGSSGVPSPSWTGSASAPSSAFGSSSSSSLSS